MLMSVSLLKRNSISLVITVTARTQKTINIYEFCDISHPWGKSLAYRKVYYFCDRKNHFKVCCQYVGEKAHVERDESDEPSDQKDYDFFLLKLLISTY